jgi:hypothetical protein
MTMAVILMTVIIVPTTALETHAAHMPVSVELPKVQSKVALGAVLAVPGAIVATVRGVGAIAYATKNSDGSVGNWISLMTAHMSGNADEIEGLNDLRSVMQEQHKMTQDAIADLKNDIADLRKDISDQLAQLENTAEYIYLRTALNQFYTEFFASGYAELESAYLNVTDALSDPYANDAVIRAKMDDLYMKAYKLKNLQGYITGDINFENKSVLDLYYEYLLRSGNVQPADTEAYRKILEKCQEFSLKLFAADAFQRYCLAYASSYQLNYVYEHMDEMSAQGTFVGYVLDGTLDGFSNKMTLQEIKRNIAGVEGGSDLTSAHTAANLSKLYLLNREIGYREGGAQYFVPVSGNAMSVYSGSAYQMSVLPDELQALFAKDFSFVISNETAAEISDSGHITVNGPINTKFTVSYVYGEGVLETPLTVYSIDFTVVAKRWAGGYGTEKAPYLISSVAHLKDFATASDFWASGVYTRLVSDINASDASISAIKSFAGVFDGNYHTISNLSRSSGLFETNSGVIKNLTLSSLSLNIGGVGPVVIGGLVDTNRGVIDNCHVKNSSLSVYRHNYKSGSSYTSFTVHTGGIAGVTQNGVIRNCSVSNTNVKAEISTRELYDAGMVFSSDDMTIKTIIYIGGISGLTSGATLENNYVENTTVSTRTYAKYYKWVLLWEHTYNRVNATIYTGIIAGNQSGSFYDNFSYNSNNSSNPIDKLAANKSDDSFVTGSPVNGVQGVALTSAKKMVHLTSIALGKLPHQKLYRKGESFNPCDLLIVDNFGNPVYGYRVVSEETDEQGKKTVVTEYKGYRTSFSVEVGCLHKNIDYVYEKMDRDSMTFYTAGIFCNDCAVYTDGREEIAHESCDDADEDHACDLCDGFVGIHEGGSDTHLCAYCGKTASECADDDNDHSCDICSAFMGMHEAGENGHVCEYCGKPVTACTDIDKNHVCDLCGGIVGTHAGGADTHICSYCGKAATDCADSDRNHACDICGIAMGAHVNGANTHICGYCGKPVTACGDIDKNHICDVCGDSMGAHVGGTNTHICAYCGKAATACADGDKNHACDVCGIAMGTHAGGANTHACEYCGKVATVCADGDKNHACDICGAVMGTHVAEANGHICAYCGGKASDCIDTDRNHACDKCGAVMGEHVETDHGHACAYCGKAASVCRDTDKNHVCDLCSQTLGDHTVLSGSHTCTYCGAQISVCADANEDSFCDICNAEVKRENKVLVIGAVGIGVIALVAVAFALGKRR